MDSIEKMIDQLDDALRQAEQAVDSFGFDLEKSLSREGVNSLVTSLRGVSSAMTAFSSLPNSNLTHGHQRKTLESAKRKIELIMERINLLPVRIQQSADALADQLVERIG